MSALAFGIVVQAAYPTPALTKKDFGARKMRKKMMPGTMPECRYACMGDGVGSTNANGNKL